MKLVTVTEMLFKNVSTVFNLGTYKSFLRVKQCLLKEFLVVLSQ